MSVAAVTGAAEEAQETEEAAHAVALLASEEASHITGAVPPVDGDLTVPLPEVL